MFNIKLINGKTFACDSISLIYGALQHAQTVAILMVWGKFTTYFWKQIYANMKKPAYVFDGIKILNKEEMKQIGF